MWNPESARTQQGRGGQEHLGFCDFKIYYAYQSETGGVACLTVRRELLILSTSKVPKMTLTHT